MYISREFNRDQDRFDKLSSAHTLLRVLVSVVSQVYIDIHTYQEIYIYMHIQICIQ